MCTGGEHTTWLPALNLNFSVPPIGPIGPAPRSDARAATRKREEEEGGKRCTALRNHFIAADATARCREEGTRRDERERGNPILFFSSYRDTLVRDS